MSLIKTVHNDSIKNKKLRSSKSKENIQMKEDGPDCRVSDDKLGKHAVNAFYQLP